MPPLVPVLLELPLKEGVRPSHHCVFSVVICVLVVAGGMGVPSMFEEDEGVCPSVLP